MDEHSNQAEKAQRADQSELSGMTAVVTGASSGIGRAIACELARGGAAVAIHARQNQAAADETARLIQALGGETTVLLSDLSHGHNRELLAKSAWNWRGAIDIWVNNAGIDVLTGPSARLSFEDKLQKLWEVDVAATIHLSRLVGRQMKERGRGTLINIGWDQAEHGMAGESGELFSAVKGAVMAFTKSLAQSLAPEVRVNCVAPGWIKTSWGENASPYWQQRACRESLTGRWGTPEDVAQVVRFAASPAARFLNGQILSVNGGFRFGAGG